MSRRRGLFPLFSAAVLAAFCNVGVASAQTKTDQPSAEKGSAPAPSEAEAVDASKSFIAMIDAGKYGDSWDNLAAPTKNVINRGAWDMMMSATRRRFGVLTSRTFESALPTTTVPGQPDGQYVVIKYRSAFTARKNTDETVVCTLDEGRWKVLRYEIKRAK